RRAWGAVLATRREPESGIPHARRPTMSGTPSAGRGHPPVALRQARSRHLSSLWTVALALGWLAHAQPAPADVIPPERLTNWNPGIPGGIPSYTTVCATVNASDY